MCIMHIVEKLQQNIVINKNIIPFVFSLKLYKLFIQVKKPQGIKFLTACFGI